MVLENIDFVNIISDLESVGFYDVVLPFFLIFTIIFGILEKTSIFGKDSHKFNIVIALVAGFLMVRNDTLVALMNRFLPNVSMFVLVIIALLIVLGIFGIQSDKWGGGLLFVFFIIGLVGVIWALGNAAEEEGIAWLPDWLEITETDIQWIAFIAAGLIVFWLLVSKKKEGEDMRMYKGFKDIGDSLRGSGK
ncbi:MAG: hypothetical protein V1645_02250 [archaeon]